jgi:hypothetical protein
MKLVLTFKREELAGLLKKSLPAELFPEGAELLD